MPDSAAGPARPNGARLNAANDRHPRPGCPGIRFADAERLVVEAARAWALHKGPNYLFERRLVIGLGAEGAESAVRPFHALMTILIIRARRQARFLRPGAAEVTADERALVALVAAAGRGDGAIVAMHLEWLLAGPRSPDAAVSAERVARVLAANGLVFAAIGCRRGSGFPAGAGGRTAPAAPDADANLNRRRRPG